MYKLDWGKSTHEEEDVLVVDPKFLNIPEAESPKYADIRKMKTSGIAGYINGKYAVKISDPSLEDISSGLKLKQYTLNQGVEHMNNNDDKYSELKEDLRDSERRIASDFKEREQRFEREANRREDRFEKTIERITNEAKEREERYLNSVEEIKQIVADGEKNRKSTTIAMWTLAITTLLGIAAMVITVAVTT